MKIPYKAFGKLKLVEAQPQNGATPEDYYTTLWIERGEDWYSMMSPQLKGKKVMVVTREAWLAGELILD